MTSGVQFMLIVRLVAMLEAHFYNYVDCIFGDV
jgi:hypothetical protein